MVLLVIFSFFHNLLLLIGKHYQSLGMASLSFLLIIFVLMCSKGALLLLYWNCVMSFSLKHVSKFVFLKMLITTT